MKKLYVFYDEQCGLCRRCRDWLQKQPAWIELIFFSFQSRIALKLCPALPTYHPERQLIALSDEGALYAGESAWLACLWALREYRPWAERLATPALRPLAHRLCLLISHNRITLSKALFAHLAKSYTDLPEPPSCDGTTCSKS